MQNELNAIVNHAKDLILASKEVAEIQELRVKYLGKKSQLTDLMKQLGQLDPAERPKAGQWINDAKQQLQAWLTEHENTLKNAELNARLSSETIDITLSGRGKSVGSLHPVTRVRERVVELFSQIGRAS